MPRPATQKMRPCTMITVGTREITGDAQHSVYDLVARSEAAFRANDERHDAKATAANSDHIGIARDGFAREPAIRFRSVPVVREACLLNHREKFVVGHE